jgi:hypothetical protein
MQVLSTALCVGSRWRCVRLDAGSIDVPRYIRGCQDFLLPRVLRRLAISESLLSSPGG